MVGINRDISGLPNMHYQHNRDVLAGNDRLPTVGIRGACSPMYKRFEQGGRVVRSVSLVCAMAPVLAMMAASRLVAQHSDHAPVSSSSSQVAKPTRVVPALDRPMAAPSAAVTPSARPSEDVRTGLPVVVSADRSIKRWDTSGRLQSTLVEQGGQVNGLAVVPGSGNSAIMTVSADGLLRTWDLTSGKVTASFDTHHGEALALAISTDGALVATAGADGHIRLWQRTHGRLLADVKAHNDLIHSLCFTSDSRGLVSASADRMLRVWRVGDHGATLDYVSNIVAHDGPITAISLAPDERTVASVSTDGFLKVWELPSGAQLVRVRVTGHGIASVAYSPDGKTLATGDDEGKLRLWNAQSGMPLAFNGSREGSIRTLAFTSGGNIVVAGSADKTISYWNVSTGRQIACIAAHEGAIQALVIVP